MKDLFKFMDEHPVLTFVMLLVVCECIHCCFKEVAVMFRGHPPVEIEQLEERK